tara:strand:+ start:79 stop:993 length:915 start_codon:yes stop_codon:yes gene_type:complete
MIKDEIKEEIKRFDDWEWGYNLGGITQRPNNPKHEALQKLKVNHLFDGIRSILGISDSEEKPLKGLRVLDVGCGEGIFSIAARKLGADYVLGLEPRQEKVEQAKFICRAQNIDSVEFKQMRIMEISKQMGTFDIVLFIGVLYVMEKPFEAIGKLSEVTKDILVIDTELIPIDYPILAAKESLPNVAYNTFDSGLTFTPSSDAVAFMLKYSGFEEPQKLLARGKNWSANSYTRHYLTGHRGAFISRKSNKALPNRLWPKGALHPPNRVHSALFRSIIKPSFWISSLGNEINKLIFTISNFFKKNK